MRTLRLPVLAIAASLSFGLPAYAEEGPEAGDPLAKLRAQAAKVLKLMQENEAALLQASTVGGKAPKGPDVPLPPDAPEGGAGQPPQGEQGGVPPVGPRGAEIRRQMDELLRGQRTTGASIPGELEELMRLVPT